MLWKIMRVSERNGASDKKQRIHRIPSLANNHRRLLRSCKARSRRMLLFVDICQRMDVPAISDRTFRYGQISLLGLAPVPCLYKLVTFFNSFLVVLVALLVIKMGPHGRISRSIFQDVSRDKRHKVFLYSKSAIVFNWELQEMVYQK